MIEIFDFFAKNYPAIIPMLTGAFVSFFIVWFYFKISHQIEDLGKEMASLGKEMVSLDKKIVRLDEKMDERFAKVYERFAKSDERFLLLIEKMGSACGT